ncbi:MAG: trehalose-phosphatase [Chloroflexi bacterium]|nr:trehalose-phosphatase [Chloroflexota bacterium]
MTTSSGSALQPTLSPSLRSELRAVASGPSLLALDYDGTLAPFRAERSEARMPDELRELLATLAACEATHVAIVSGRPIAELEALIELDPLPELFGVHGWERRLPDGRRADHAPPPRAAAAIEAEWRRLAGELGDQVAQRLERKSASLALHVRGLEAAEGAALIAGVEPRWRDLAEEHGLDLRRFDGGIELRCAGRGKGDVLRELLAELPEGAPAAYLGDDETDEDAFRAIVGRDLGVLVAEQPRETAAAHVIAPAAVAALLREWLRHAREAPGARGAEGTQ